MGSGTTPIAAGSTSRGGSFVTRLPLLMVRQPSGVDVAEPGAELLFAPGAPSPGAGGWRSRSSMYEGQSAGQPGRCAVWQLLVDALMTHSKAGQAFVLQQLSDTNGSRQLLPLRHAVS